MNNDIDPPVNRAAASRAVLLVTDRANSVLSESTGSQINRVSYSAYGTQSAQAPRQSLSGFNGQYREPRGWYHLGNGHRVYNPVLRRFHSPDHLSPFAEGGLNPYTYCLGDPINHTDPTGRDAQFLHTAALIGFGFALLAGGVSIFGPMILKSAAASATAASATLSATGGSAALTMKQAAIGKLAKYVEMMPGVGTTLLGGLDAFSTFVSVAGAPIGAVGAIQSMQEDPSQVTSELMWAGAAMSLFAVPVKTLVVPLTPKLPTSRWGKRVARLVHGRDKIAAARKEAADAMRLADIDAAAARSAVGSAGGSARPSISSGPSGPPKPTPRRKRPQRSPASEVHPPNAVLPEINFTLRRGNYETSV